MTFMRFHDFVVERLCDFFGSCVIFFGLHAFCVEGLRFVDRLLDFLCGLVA